MSPANAADSCPHGRTTVVNNLLCYLSCMRDKMTQDVLVGLVCDFYKQEEIIQARDIYYGLLPEDPESKIRKTKFKLMKDNVTRILNFMHQTSNDALPLFVASDVSNIPSRDLGSIDAVTLQAQYSGVKEDVQSLKADNLELRAQVKSMMEEFKRMQGKQLEEITRMQAEQRSLREFIHARFTVWDRVGVVGQSGKPHLPPAPPLGEGIATIGVREGEDRSSTSPEPAADTSAEESPHPPVHPTTQVGDMDVQTNIVSYIAAAREATTAAGSPASATTTPLAPTPAANTPPATTVTAAVTTTSTPTYTSADTVTATPAAIISPDTATAPTVTTTSTPSPAPADAVILAAIPTANTPPATTTAPAVFPTAAPADTVTHAADTGPSTTLPITSTPAVTTSVPDTHTTTSPSATGSGDDDSSVLSYSAVTQHQPRPVTTTAAASTAGSTTGSPTPASVGGPEDGFMRQKRRHNKPKVKPPTTNGPVPSGPPRKQPTWYIQGSKSGNRLGPSPTCQVLVRGLTPQFPLEELTTYVREMLGDESVKVEVCWRRATAAFVVTAAVRHREALFSCDNWESHVSVLKYSPPKLSKLPTRQGAGGATVPSNAPVSAGV